ncbi:MAG: hypothetical protein RXQ71_06575 [Caldisphaera sp.]
MGFAVYYYITLVPYSYFGSYRGWPIYIQSPPLWMLITYLFLVIISIIAIFMSVNINKKNIKIIQLLTLSGIISLILSVGILYMSSYKIIYTLVGGYSDSYIIQISAAKTLLKLQNPYSSNYLQYLIFKESYPYYTYIFKYPYGYSNNKIIGFVSSYDYLGFAMLYYIPKVLLNIPKGFYDAIIYSLALFLAYRKMQEPYKSLFPLILSSASFIFIGEPVLFSPIVGWIALVIIAIAYSDHPLLSGLLFGLAVSYRETAGVFFIFYLIALYYEKYNIKNIIYGFLISSLLVNLPFLILSPNEFIKGALLPLTFNLMPIGAGLSTLTQYGIYLPKILYTSLFLSIIIIGLVIYAKYYSKLKYAGLVLPAIAFLFYYRPLPFYYMWFPLFSLIAYSTSINGGKLKNTTKYKIIDIDWFIMTYELLIISLILFLIRYVSNISSLVLIIGFIGLASISIIAHLLETNKLSEYYKPKYITYIILVSLIIAGAFASRFTPGLSIYISSKAYQSSQNLIIELASLEIVKLHNPYNVNYYYYVLKNPSFGYLSQTLPYNNTIINLTKIDPQKEFSIYFDYKNKSWNNITVYNFLPGLALLYIPASLFSLSAHAYSSIIYAITLLLLGLFIYKHKDMNLFLISIFIGFFATILYFSFNAMLTIILSFLILSLLLAKYSPTLSGIFYSLSILTYPDIFISAPFYIIFIYYNYKLKFKRFLTSFLITSSLLILAFYLTSNNFINYSFMQLIYYIKDDINLGLLLNLNPIILLVVGITLTAILSIYYYYNFNKIKELGLLLPIFTSLLLPSLSLGLISIFIMLAFVSYFLLEQKPVV